jgi:hypothetical protein
MATKVIKVTDNEKPKRRVLPRSVVRAMMMKSTEGGTFRCPGCRERFTIKYSRFGRFGAFGDPTYYCKDCSRTSTFCRC